MGIVNRRNALIGWGVVKLGKRQLRSKAKLPGRKSERRVPGLSAVVSGGAALAGAVWYAVRRKRSGERQAE